MSSGANKGRNARWSRCHKYVAFASSYSSVKLPIFEIWALNCTKMHLAARLCPDRWGSYCHFSHAFDAPLGGPRRHVAISFGMEKPEWWFVSTQYERDRQTDAARRNRPRLHSMTRQCSYNNLYKTQNMHSFITRMFNTSTLYSEIFSSQASDKSS